MDKYIIELILNAILSKYNLKSRVAIYLVRKLVERIFVPAFDQVNRKVKLYFTKKEIDKTIEELRNAKTKSDWNTAIDNLA